MRDFTAFIFCVHPCWGFHIKVLQKNAYAYNCNAFKKTISLQFHLKQTPLFF